MVRNIIIVSSNCQPKYVQKIPTPISDNIVIPRCKCYGRFTMRQSLFLVILLNCATGDRDGKSWICFRNRVSTKNNYFFYICILHLWQKNYNHFYSLETCTEKKCKWTLAKVVASETVCIVSWQSIKNENESRDKYFFPSDFHPLQFSLCSH